jgi:hypothetical protein
MFERVIQAANHFRRFEERLRFGLLYFLNVAAQMIDQCPESFRTFAVCARGSFDAIISISCVRLQKGEQTHQSAGIEETRGRVTSWRPVQPVFRSTSLRIFSVCAAAFGRRSVCAQPIWLLVVPTRTLAAFAMLRVPYAPSSCPDTF